LLAADGDGGGLVRLVSELLALNQEWLDKQTVAADMLSQRAGRLGDHEQAATALEQALLDQAAQIRSACESLAAFDVKDELEHQGKRLLERIITLLVHAHVLRDGILDLLATMMKAGNALESLGASVERDGLTRLPNRIGLETLLGAWWREDPQRSRLLSVIMIDIDRFGRLNQRLGTRAGDGAIVAVARLIDDSLAKDRALERLVRVGGESFFVLQGDVGPHQALATAERLRQAIEATTFDDEGTEFDLTVSCGVIEVKHGDSSLELVRRTKETLVFAKKSGRNRCALDKGDGPAMLDPPQFPVKARTMSLRAAMMSVAGG
jgi:diguanylate cyclase (GGDEF)-like protein